MSLNLELQAHILQQYADQLDGEIQIKQDAVIAMFDTGLAIELRYLNPNEYFIKWAWGDAELHIDTAPVHKDISSFPNHLHDAEAKLRPDTLTTPGKAPWDNVRHLIDKLLQDPLLESNQ